ncbi:alpha-glucosidase C-terminal domain-containing protein [Stieleria sp. JC731]|uniref:alpha-amylase family glycosyl hydrolase n=1 Tax=Pirellulaceae TaxID=2691357 RepID=UPI001E3093F8|nr:alpha-amylase family glycosyl hydrolase [Stieleria sp. JC731]MCC9599999.1 alpha-glucosidase C-terminal domain-containing protein [Stieleria sp. JC731]
MIELIRSIYPEHLEEVHSGIEALLEKYAAEIKAGTQDDQEQLTQKDSILITYGDSFRSDGISPLQCLRRFATEQLGDSVSAVHLLPCFPYTSDDGFSVQDYYQIDPKLGNWFDMQELGESFDLMFDAVVNHISKSSDWFQGYLNGVPEFDEFFIAADPDADYSSVTRPRALPLLHPFKRGDETVHIWTTFSEDQVDLNFHNPNVFLAVLDVLLFYVARGAKFIRLDAIAFIWKEHGTSCMHLKQTHEIIQLCRKAIEQLHPHVALITETNVPHKENISYFGDGTNEAHLVYNFTLPPLLMYSLHQQSVEKLTEWASSLVLPSDQTCFFNFTASHDGVGVRPLQGIIDPSEIDQLADIARSHGGFVSMRDNGDGTQSPYEINCNYFDFATDPSLPDEVRVQRFLLTQSVMLAIPGVPGIYYHSIVGSQNDRQAAIDSGINRRINRAKLQYDPLADELTDSDSIRGKVFKSYKAMLDVRGQEPLFDPYGKATYSSQGPVFIIKRAGDGTELFAVHNFSDQEQTVQLSAAPLSDMLSQSRFGDASAESCNVTLKPYEFMWLKTS